MASKSNIEWTDATWNPIVGCSIVSPGCTNCYAMQMAARIESMFDGTKGAMHYRGTTKKVNGNAVWTGKVALAPDHILTAPLRWKKPRRIFVNSMGDLFHESIPDEWIDRVFAVTALCPQHTFQVLTKRAERMRDYMIHPQLCERQIASVSTLIDSFDAATCERLTIRMESTKPFPRHNIWLGVSCERQQEADERIPLLLATPAAIRFISAEPLLGPIDFGNLRAGTFDALTGCGDRERLGVWEDTPRLDWIIVGGESGRNARPMHPQWARDIRDQCEVAGVAFFFKQHGEYLSVDHIPVGQIPNDVFLFKVMGQPALARVGKTAAGRLLDGVEYSGFPKARA